MKKVLGFFFSLLIICNLSLLSYAAEKDVTLAFEDEEIPVVIKNEFDEEIQVQLDTNRKYTIGPSEKIVIGNRKPGKYTLTIYNKRGEFVDNITQNISKQSRWVLNNDTVANDGKIDSLSTGQKVAITAGAVGVATLGGALIHMALQNKDEVDSSYVPPEYIPQYVAPPQPAISNTLAQLPHPAVPATVSKAVSAFSDGGSLFKIVNSKYDQVTLIVEGADGNPIGSNWIIPKASIGQSPQPLLYDGQNVTIGTDQKVIAVTPEGYELQRYAFELAVDPADGGYVWIIK
ncbi:MAG: hypothetical protein HYR97_00210 [Candidatus Melainabacteria bacterium]|nr:hypothetical protein [Candidatus Melainabacteria bacterium]MBI3309696.1 hypothetical protein [Candidatus Melainabacteria bacterium]